MVIYIAKDDEPLGGYFSAFSWKPDMSKERKTISELRAVEMPEETWDFILNQGGLPFDVDGNSDSAWMPWWREGETVWTRD